MHRKYQEYKIALWCKIHPGCAPWERVFEVELANGSTYMGVVPRCFCWEDQGLVAAHLISAIDEHQVEVQVPNNNVLAVDFSRLRPRPKDVTTQ